MYGDENDDNLAISSRLLVEEYLKVLSDSYLTHTRLRAEEDLTVIVGLMETMLRFVAFEQA